MVKSRTVVVSAFGPSRTIDVTVLRKDTGTPIAAAVVVYGHLVGVDPETQEEVYFWVESKRQITKTDGKAVFLVEPDWYAVRANASGFIEAMETNIDATIVDPPPITLELGSKAPCFVATVAYGSALAPQLSVLRRFRNHCLPKMLVNLYYKVGPYLAQFIKEREAIKRYVRESLTLFVKLLGG